MDINVNWYPKCSYFLSILTNKDDANYDKTLILTQETKEFPTDIQKGKKDNNSIYRNIVWKPQKKFSEL